MASALRVKLFAVGALLLAAAVALSAAPVNSYSTGVATTDTGTGATRGCTCHNGAQNGEADVTFEVKGLPNGYYEASQTYTVTLSFTDAGVPMNASPTVNHGGFSVWASAGKFKLNENSSRDVTGDATLEPLVALKDTDTSVTHTKEGDVYGNRSWSFDWEAPASNASDVTFDIVVNAVNGDNVQSPADHWTRTYRVLPGLPGGGGGDVDISKLGVPLRAYWLGVIGILSTIFLLVLSFYVIRSGSKFYEFGLPRGQVQSVKIRTIPPPKNKGAYAVMTALIVIALVVVLTFLSLGDAQLGAFEASMFLLGFVTVVAMAAVYYIRAFLPIVDVLEEEEIEPLQ